jgi:RNA polymerase sigma-70 factor, ECF subfamily
MLSQNNSSPVISTVGDAVVLKKLVISAKNGNKEAFDRLFQVLYTPLYRYSLSKCQDEAVAEDICQQSFLNFYQSLGKYEPEKSPLAYLFTIAKRLLINHHEKKTFESFDEAFYENYSDGEDSIIDEANTKQLAKSINTYLIHLSRDEQDIIRLYFYAELSYKEISEILDKEEAYLRKIKERALKKLRILASHLHE